MKKRNGAEVKSKNSKVTNSSADFQPAKGIGQTESLSYCGSYDIIYNDNLTLRGINNDPNCLEEPDYILKLIKKVTTVSVETVKIVKEIEWLRLE